MTRRLLLTYLLLAALVLAALEVPLGVQHARSAQRDLAARVERDAGTLATFAEDGLESGGRVSPALVAAARRYARQSGGRVVVVDRRGRAILDTSGPRGRSFASRPEVSGALAGAVTSGERHSRTLGHDLLVVAVPVASGGRVHGAVRLSFATSALDGATRRYWLMLAAIAAVVLAATAIIGELLARSFARPLSELERATAAGGRGDLSVRARSDAGPHEVRAVARSFNDMVARLDDLVRSQVGFVADASHQLRSPLTALRLRLENLERDVAPGGRDDLEGALGEVERLSRLVDGLLVLARADAQPAAPEDVPVADVLGARARAWAALTEGNGVRVHVDDGARLQARATPGALEQVLDNLIGNALDASPRGGTITLRAEAAGADGIAVHVVDEGPGMSATERASAFDRFFRGGHSEGFGLGLAIVQRLVTADGGQVELLEAPGGGVDAVVRLPRARAAEGRGARPRRPLMTTAGS